MNDKINDMKMMRIIDHLAEKHSDIHIDYIHATKNKEIDKNTRTVVCAVCEEEFIRVERKLIDIEELNNILKKHNLDSNNIVTVEYILGKTKILDIHFIFDISK